MNERAEPPEPSPERAAQVHAKRDFPKRFYRDVTVERREDGKFTVLLDGRPVRTPARMLLALPSEAAAWIVAEEFAAQEEVIDPGKMPATRLVNSALDGVDARREEVAADILRFASADLICYRAEGPQRLCALQDEAWNPVLHWAEEKLGVRLNLVAGVVHVEQPRESIEALAAAIARHESPLALAAIHSMTSLTGSALLAVAVAERALSMQEAWAAAHVDEDWNIAQWGEDAEATQRRQYREGEMRAAADLLQALAG